MPTTSLNFEAVTAKPVVLAPTRTVELWIIGCGGTGSFLVQLLCRVVLALAAQGRTTKLVLVDPDHVEAKNVIRQCFCEAEVGLNKAQTLALRYSAAFGVPIEALAHPLNHRCSSIVPMKLVKFSVAVSIMRPLDEVSLRPLQLPGTEA